MMHPDTIQRVRDFRSELCMLFGKRADALFDLCDAAVTAGLGPSMAYLSYAALAEGQIDIARLLAQEADRWTWLIVAAYTQLRLARSCVADQRLPWQRRLDPEKLTPYRVRRASSSLLVALGTPAKAPDSVGALPDAPRAAAEDAQRATRP